MEWIKCSERMPEVRTGMNVLSNDLLLFHVDKDVFIGIYDIGKSEWFEIVDGSIDDRLDITPSHWMKAPYWPV